MVRVIGPHCVDVILRRKGRKLLVHLVNLANKQTSSNYAVIDFIPPLGPLKLTIRLVEKPREVYTVPRNRKASIEWENNSLSVILQQLEIHTVIVIKL